MPHGFTDNKEMADLDNEISRKTYPLQSRISNLAAEQERLQVNVNSLTTGQAQLQNSITTEHNRITNLQTYLENYITTLQNTINDYWKKVYPVGSIYTSISATNPASFLGGTWVQFGAGRTLVGVDTTQTEFNAVSKTGGAKNINYTPSGTVGNHTLTVEELPEHAHYLNAEVGYNGVSSGDASVLKFTFMGEAYGRGIRTSGSVGQAHNHGFTGTAATMNNLQPYVTVYFWRRTA